MVQHLVVLLSLALVASPHLMPRLVAIVNPLSGRSWDATGRPVACPFSATGLAQMREMSDPDHMVAPQQDPRAVPRLLLFDRGSSRGLIVEAPGMPYNGGSMPGTGAPYDMKPSREILLARVLPTQKWLDVEAAAWDIWPWQTVVELKLQNDRVTVLKGAERHPRMIPLSPGERLTPTLKVVQEKFVGNRSDSKTAIVFDERPPGGQYRFRSMSDDFLGRKLNVSPGPERPGSRIFMIRTASGNVGRFTYQRQRVLRLRLPMQPVTTTTRKAR